MPFIRRPVMAALRRMREQPSTPMGRSSARPAFTVLLICAGLAIVSLWLMLTNLDVEISLAWGSKYSRPVLAVLYMSFPLMGYLVSIHRPKNAVGPLLLLAGLLVELQVFADAYSFFLSSAASGSFPPGSSVARWFSDWLWLIWMGVMGIYLVLVFPDGHLVSRRWRWVVIVGVISIAMTVTSEALRPGPLEGAPRIDNPFGIEGAERLLELLYLGLVPWFICIVAAVWSMRTRYVLAGHAERQQLKWFFYACVLVAGPTLIAGQSPESGQEQWALAIQDIQIVSWAALPIAAGIGVLRYRLYEIDVIINRTLVYSVLSLALGAFYFVLVASLQLVLRPLTGESSVAVAASTLAVAALFRPVRSAVQRFIDHRFYRRRYDSQRVLEFFGERMRSVVDLDEVKDELVGAVNSTMRPTGLSLWINERADSTSIGRSEALQ